MQETIAQLRDLATTLGFRDLRVTAAVEARGFSRLVEWLDSGFAGDMNYFQNRLAAYRHPGGVMEGVRTIIVLTLPYPSSESEELPAGSGRTARYTWLGDDYHDLIHSKLKALSKRLTALQPDCRVRGVVDTAPLMEREFAQLAGIGWQAKNTLVINKFAGSYFFLACLLTDLDLPVDQAHETDHCGSCRRCLDACPTDAFPQPGVLDATRCISYLTIEHRDPIPMDLRSSIGDWVFGCDICQEVCPWNRPERLVRMGMAIEPPESMLGAGDVGLMELTCLFELDEQQFRTRFRKTPMWRVRRRGLLRNAAIVLGNARCESSIDALSKGVKDEEPLIRGACVWALRQIGGERADLILRRQRAMEQDLDVLAEFSAQSFPETRRTQTGR